MTTKKSYFPLCSLLSPLLLLVSFLFPSKSERKEKDTKALFFSYLWRGEGRQEGKIRRVEQKKLW